MNRKIIHLIMLLFFTAILYEQNLAQKIRKNSDKNSNKSIFSIRSDSVQKVHLFEEFTSSTCGSCPDYNRDVVEPATQKYRGKVAVVKYQMDFPGIDRYFIPVNKTRGEFYGIMGVPALYIDGITSPWLLDVTGLWWLEVEGHSPEENLNYIDSVFMSDDEQWTGVEIKSKHKVYPETGKIEVNATITPFISGTGYKIFICVVEKKTTGNAGSNGEKEFFNVMMKMLPNDQGISMSFVEGISQDIQLTADLKNTHIEEYTDLSVVLFVQDMTTKKVIQAAYSEEKGDITRTVFFNLPEKDIKLYPNPSRGIMNISGVCGAMLKIYDLAGKELLSINAAKSHEIIDMTSFKKGIYLLKVMEVEKTFIHKLTIY